MTELKKTASFKEQFAQAAEKQSFDQLTKKFFFKMHSTTSGEAQIRNLSRTSYDRVSKKVIDNPTVPNLLSFKKIRTQVRSPNFYPVLKHILLGEGRLGDF